MAVDPILAVSLGMTVLALVLSAAGAGTTGWFVTDNIGVGLFQVCVEASGKKLCVDVDDEGTVQSARVLILLGILLALIACGFLVALMVMKPKGDDKKQRTLYTITMVLSSIGGSLIMSGTIRYSTDITGYSSEYELGYSFGLCVTASILLIVSSFVLCCGRMKRKQSNVLVNPVHHNVVTAQHNHYGQPGYPTQPFTAQYPNNMATYPSQPFGYGQPTTYGQPSVYGQPGIYGQPPPNYPPVNANSAFSYEPPKQ